MTALIMVDLERVHPVIEGRWHQARFERLPEPGEPVRTLCGLVEAAEYCAVTSRSPSLERCWVCDLAHRRLHGMDVLPTHPGLPRARGEL
ncbi:hypothetical protein [Amycolatopsis sp. H20-H5]|uniref:hypothetical protein n=1 Tax=Amycolatopsis sp. H20-H5 TaxID=3046309 RepID=UPI002DBF90C4|nr:hypothetical protein [Amycolatopsis sp. H20-H5]MEC3982428.1 hypothetical protein [Amycolatopsis sp. H20-H5]